MLNGFIRSTGGASDVQRTARATRRCRHCRYNIGDKSWRRNARRFRVRCFGVRRLAECPQKSSRLAKAAASGRQNRRCGRRALGEHEAAGHLDSKNRRNRRRLS